MARQLIVLALVFIAIVGLASAADSPAHAPTTSSPKAAGSNDDTVSETPAGSDEVIGNTDESPASSGDHDVVAAPIGSEESQEAMGPSAVEVPPSGASALQVSAFAGVAAAASFFF